MERELKRRRAAGQDCGRVGMRFCQARIRNVHEDVALQFKLCADETTRKSKVHLVTCEMV